MTDEIEVTEVEEIRHEGKPHESRSYTYTSPTHWASDGACRIHCYDICGEKSAVVRWGSGGTNGGFSQVEIAEAMSTAFTMAAKRLAKLEKKGWQINHEK